MALKCYIYACLFCHTANETNSKTGELTVAHTRQHKGTRIVCSILIKWTIGTRHSQASMDHQPEEILKILAG